jgi:hypothetical protein
MNRVARYTYILEIACILASLFMAIFHIVLWIGGTSIANLFLNFGYFEHTFESLSVVSQVAMMPLSHRLLGLLVDSIMLVIAISGVITFVNLLRQLRSGQFFTREIINALRRLSIIALIWAIYNPLRYVLLSVITTWHLGSGHRILALAIGSTDLMNIMIFACFVLITALMHEGYKLKQDRDLTI